MLNRLFLLPFFLVFLVFPSWSQVDSLPSLDLVFAGDIMGHDSQIKAAEVKEDSLYDYYDCFRYVQPILRSNDLAIGNLELTLPGMPPYEGYPQFRSPDDLALALRYAGFNVLVTANNHSNDAGSKGLSATLDAIDDYHFLHTGTFRDTLERRALYPLLIYRNQFKIALLNYTYGTNGIPTRKPTWVNRIDPDIIRKDLEETKRYKPDFVIVMVHWGKEYQTTESKGQQKLAQSMIKWGADMVIGGHPHVVQPIKTEQVQLDSNRVKEGLVVYSLGNFISGQTKRYTNGGILFGMQLEKTPSGKTRLKDHYFLPCYRYRKRASTGILDFSVIPIHPYLKESPEGLVLSKENREAMKAYRNHVLDVMKGSAGKEWQLSLEALKKLAEKKVNQ